MKPWLTSSSDKATAYVDDIYFRESWADATEKVPDPSTTLRCTTYVLIKPEAVASGRAGRLAQLLVDRGLHMLDVRAVRMDRRTVRELWRYQLNGAPLATLTAVDLVASAAPSLLVLLADDGSALGEGGSMTARLSAAKGASAGPRGPDTLRALLGSTVQVLNFLHVPDEPADLVRELGVWFDRPQRGQVYRLLTGRSAPRKDAQERILRFEARTSRCDLELGPAEVRLTAATGPSCRALTDEVLAALHGDCPADRLVELVQWVAGLKRLPVWDRAVVAAHLVQRQPPARAPLLGPPITRSER
jgi:nucleoside diphosphate kinase